MANKKISAFPDPPSMVNASRFFVMADTALNVDYRVSPNKIAQFVVPIGGVSPDGVLFGYKHQLFSQLVLPSNLSILWVNVDGASSWRVINGTGITSPDGVLEGTIGATFLQLTGGFFLNWINTDGVVNWSVISGSGAIDPNGVVKGIKGATWSEIPDDGSAIPWINTTGSTVWI